MRESDGEKGFVPLHCLHYNKEERCVYLSLSAGILYHMKRYSVGVCVSLTVPLFLQVYVCARAYSVFACVCLHHLHKPSYTACDFL